MADFKHWASLLRKRSARKECCPPTIPAEMQCERHLYLFHGFSGSIWFGVVTVPCSTELPDLVSCRRSMAELLYFVGVRGTQLY